MTGVVALLTFKEIHGMPLEPKVRIDGTAKMDALEPDERQVTAGNRTFLPSRQPLPEMKSFRVCTHLQPQHSPENPNGILGLTQEVREGVAKIKKM
jgi:hypothetical protein